MNIYIPYWINGQLSPNVIRTIGMQNTECNIVVVSSIRTPDRAGEYYNRNLIFKLAHDTEFFVMQDSDISHVRYDNIKEMLEYLKIHPSIGYVSVRAAHMMKHTDHIDTGCCMVRTASLNNYILTQHASKNCCCVELKKLVEQNGYSAKYLDNVERIRLEPRP